MSDTPITPAQTDGLAETRTGIRCGDTVRHKPSQEVWVVAYADPARDDLAYCGWPDGVARLSDCELLEAASDALHKGTLRSVLQSGGSRARNARRLYGDPDASAEVAGSDPDALAQLAEIPAVGSEERERWLMPVRPPGLGQRCEGYFILSENDVLTLMSEARKQGQRDFLAASGQPDIAHLSTICARAIADANITNCYPAEAVPVVKAILAALATGGARHG